MSTVTVYSATTDGSTEILNDNGFIDIPGLSITVLNTAVGDVLHISANILSYRASSGNIRLILLVDGASVTDPNTLTYGSVDGNIKSFAVDWTITLQAGDITGGNTIVKVQFAEYGLASPNNIYIANSADGVSVLSVVQVRA